MRIYSYLKGSCSQYPVLVHDVTRIQTAVDIPGCQRENISLSHGKYSWWQSGSYRSVCRNLKCTLCNPEYLETCSLLPRWKKGWHNFIGNNKTYVVNGNWYCINLICHFAGEFDVSEDTTDSLTTKITSIINENTDKRIVDVTLWRHLLLRLQHHFLGMKSMLWHYQIMHFVLRKVSDSRKTGTIITMRHQPGKLNFLNFI